MKVLLVEDDSFFAQLLREFFIDYGLYVHTVGSVEDALKSEFSQYRAAIIDVMLPNNPEVSGVSIEESRGGILSGVALARRIREIQPSLALILYSAGAKGGEAEHWANEHGIPFISKFEGRRNFILALQEYGILGNPPAPKAFIVHGHDDKSVAELKDYLQNTLKWQEPVILRDQPNCGKTIIEKFEDYAGQVDWVFVIMTPDDKVYDPKTNVEKRRARQNVIFELGFFYGLKGRPKGRIIVLKKGEIELPSDIQGLVWIDITEGIKKSGEEIRKEVGE